MAFAELNRTVERLASPLLNEAENLEFMSAFSYLTELALAPLQNSNRRSCLCSDGTPLEISLCIDDSLNCSIRFAADVAGSLLDDGACDFHYQLRAVAESSLPQFEQRTVLLNRLFDLHLAGVLEDSKFLVWYGAGAEHGHGRVGKLYFNAEWLSRDSLRRILGAYVSSDDLDLCFGVPAVSGPSIRCVSYDFDGSGLRKINVYVPPSQLDPVRLPEAFYGLPEAGSRLRDLIQLGTDIGCVSRYGSCALAVGLRLESHAGPVAFESKVYVHLASWGISSFQQLAPLLSKYLHRWGLIGLPTIGLDPTGFEPTLLAIGLSDRRERISLYFKPKVKYDAVALI